MLPRWLTWLFVILFGYLIVTGVSSTRREPTSAPDEKAESRSYPALEALTDGKRWTHAVFPNVKETESACAPVASEAGKLPAYAVIDHRGQGKEAACGDTITLRLILWDAQGKAGEPKEVTLTLGEQKGLDALLLGIAPGETRTLFFRPQGYAKLPILKKGVQVSATVERING